MPNATARYVITADDKTKGAIASVKRGFDDIDKGARKLSKGLKAIGVGALALKAWGIAARFADASIQNLAKSNADFAKTLAETNAAFADMKRAGPLTVEAFEALNKAAKDPALRDSMRQGADLTSRMVTEVRALGIAWGIVAARALTALGIIDKAPQLDSRGPQGRGFPDYRDLGDVDAARKLGTSQNKAFDDLAKATASGAAEALKRDVQAAKDAAAALDEYAKGLVRAHEIGRELSKTGLLSIDPQQFEDTRFDQFGDSILESTEGIADRMSEALKEPFTELTPYAEQAARNMQDAFADFLFDPFDDGVKGMAKSFLDTIRRVQADKWSAKLFDWIGTKKGTGGILGGLSSLLGFAQGGDFKVGGNGGTDSQLVAFKATPGERVIVQTPAQQGRGGGITINQNVDARGASVELTKALPGLLQKASDDAVSRIQDMVSRGRL